MSFITRTQLAGFERGFSFQNEDIGPLQAKAATKLPSEAEVTIFLSHSHKDRELIQPVIAFLRSHGVKIYVDWLDEGMPDVISGETAKKIKERIQQQRKFLVLVTEHSKDSRWVPWELGYADSKKGMKHIGTLPVAEKEDFVKNEYLRIYPKIEVISGRWFLWQDDPVDCTDLVTWLRG